jgi:Imm-5 like putative immunity protein
MWPRRSTSCDIPDLSTPSEPPAACPANGGSVETSAPVLKDDAVADDSTAIELSHSELREVAGYAAACARLALAIFERERPDDRRPRVAIDAAQAFADGGERTKALRDSAWAAHRAAQEARDAGKAAPSDAACAAGNAVGAAFLHPLAKATQVKHILGSAAYAARAFELSAGDDPAVGLDQLAQSRILAPPVVVDVLRRYPSAPSGGGRVGELIRILDASLRRQATDR